MIFLVLATVACAFLLFLIIKGKKYDAVLTGLEGKNYPVRFIYVIGFALCEIPLFRLPQDVYDRKITEARLFYDNKSADYYVRVMWAQVLSFIYVSITAGLVAAGIFQNIIVLIIFIAAGAVFAADFFHSIGDDVAKRQDECTQELPEVVSSMALLVNSGMILKEAWNTVAISKDGTIYDLMRDACYQMENGVSEQDAIQNFAMLTHSQEVKKFSSSLIQGVEKGSRELGLILSEQSSEMWNVRRQHMLQKGEAASSKLLIPITLIFVGVIILVIAGASSMFGSM